MNTDDGLLTFNDSKGQVCYWYYSSLGYGTGLDIVGYIPAALLDKVDQDWTILAVVCGILLLIMLLDGSYIMHMNRELRRAVKEAEYANNAKTRFLSTMSHDIRTPMNAIIGMTEIAKKNIDDKAQVSCCLDKLTVTSRHLLTLINDVLDISKVESGSIVFIDLRIADAQHVNALEPKDGEACDLSGINVLVAEDNDLNWEIISELLSEYGVSCDRAVNGQECVDMMEASKAGQYDMIFMDVHMKKVTAVIRAVKEAKDTAN